jgi:hypothetical protein
MKIGSLKTWGMWGVAAVLVACGPNEQDSGTPPIELEEPECESNADCAGNAAGPRCLALEQTCAPAPPGGVIGWGDGSPESVEIVTVYEADVPAGAHATDLGFHKERDELWVVNRRPFVAGACTQANPQSERCRSLPGYTLAITNPGGPEQSVQVEQDGNSWHFMRRPPAIAMGDDDLFGTCGEVATGNFEDNDVMFIGPSLWSSDDDIYAKPSGKNGSHMDMLHATPWCVGMAHEVDNVYWVFNGHVGSIDRYDFVADHGPGEADHSDGIIRRFAEGTLSRVPEVPGHMEFHDGFVYVADTGNSRVVKLDTSTGEIVGDFSPVYEPLAESSMVDGAVVTDVVAPGLMEQPGGLAIHDDLLYVADHATGKMYAFTLEGELVNELDTGLGGGIIGGIEVGPDGKMWFTDLSNGNVYRIDVD